MFAEGRGLYSDTVCLLKAEGCIQTKYFTEGGCIQSMVVGRGLYSDTVKYVC